MGQQQSKDELLYQQVNYGNVEGIKALHRDGASLEWMDKEGKTPLTVASMNSELLPVAKALLELGANVNAYRPGRNGGTPLHHAAKRGLENTVKLLLSHGANALVMNDDCQTPLEVARAKGYTNVVRALEKHICLFAGWLREFYGPGFLEVLEAFAPQLLSRRVWVVVVPCGARNPTKPFKLELAVYSSQQDAKPRAVIALWKANLEEPKFHLSDPSVIIIDSSSIPRGRRRRRRSSRSRTPRQTRFKFAPANERDSQQLKWFCDACKGIPQATQPAFLRQIQPQVPATAPPEVEDMELAMAINASIQSAMHERPQPYSAPGSTEGTSATYCVSYDGSSSSHAGLVSSKVTVSEQLGQKTATAVATNETMGNASTFPSAPPAESEVSDGPIHYPSIDSSPMDIFSPAVENLPASSSTGNKRAEGGGEESCCVVCLDAPVQGACVPCGHMAGCMSCLDKIKAKKSGCPVCRTKIDQVIRLYAV
ncbi:hypothetical protein MLD38_027264 [Melastoma candidum]|uniref:Uncharacterized protein n=1 Tax=Melastoma candidum TaxID=119954 RepID=A0ACB9P332_9MYRT|nr:hypothetical protein MLD38_027264 [Melastoma candidum]